MATKSMLEQAVERQVEGLNEAQRRIVLSQFSTYKQNMDRLTEIKNRLSAVDSRTTVTLDEVRAKQADRSALSFEYNQIATANSKIAAELFEFLKEQ